MITLNDCKQKDEYDFSGVSTSPKPTNCGINSLFLELDTGNFFYFNGTTWERIPIVGGVDDLDLIKARIEGSIKRVPEESLAGITSIGTNAFFHCEELYSIDIPNTVTSIGSYAFAECKKLSDIELPENVSSIGEGAFASTNLRTLTVANPVPPTLGNNAIAKWNNSGIVNPTIFVPTESLTTYKSASGWSEYEGLIHGISNESED